MPVMAKIVPVRCDVIEGHVEKRRLFFNIATVEYCDAIVKLYSFHFYPEVIYSPLYSD